MGGTLSVVVPVYGSEEILPVLHERLTAVLAGFAPDLDYEIVCVVDGSPDDAVGVLRGIAASDERVRVISLSRNFGHQVAITAGLDVAVGDAVVVIDDDLQDPPEVISELVAKWREGYQIVHAVRSYRHGEGSLKRWTAAAFYRGLQWLSDTPMPLDSGDFRLMDRRAADALASMREESRYVRGMVAWTGFRQTIVPYARDARYSGKGHYNLRKMLRLAIDGVLSFSTKPLVVSTQFGMLVTAVSLIAAVWIVIEKLVTHEPSVPGWSSVIVTVLFMGGVQLMSIGVLGAYLGRIFYETKRRPLYFVAESINVEAAGSPASNGGR